MLKKEDKDDIIEYLRIQMETILNKATDICPWQYDVETLDQILNSIRVIAENSLINTTW